MAPRDSDTGPLPAVLPTARRRPWWILAAVALVAFVLGGAAYLQGGFGRSVQVPQVTGMTQAQAVSELTKDDLLSSVTAVSDTSPAGTVVSQDPSAGTSRPGGSTVALQISTGPKAVTIPDLSNYDQASARQRLSDVGLEVGQVKLVDSYQVAVGNVVATTPKAGSSVKEGAAVTLLVSNGRVKVPDVRGKSEDDARTALLAVGLVPDVQYVSSWRTVGTVLSQSNVGDTVTVGSNIKLTVVKYRPQPPTTVTRTYTQTPDAPASTDSNSSSDSPSSSDSSSGSPGNDTLPTDPSPTAHVSPTPSASSS